MTVAIIGAGPIGIELAVAFKQAGIDYLHFDAGQIGSTMQWYPLEMTFHSSAERLAIAGVPIQVPDQNKPKREEYLAYLRAVVQQFDLKIRTYERVENARRLDDAFELTTKKGTFHVDAIVIAIGAMHAPKLLIIGGRNSAVEAAVRCQRAGADVTVSYRRADFEPESVKFWLLPEIRSMIRDQRVRFLPNTIAREIRRDSVILDPLGEVPADFVLALTGYKQDPSLFEMLGVDMQGPDCRPKYDEETMETNVPGVFVAGTAIAGSPVERVRIIVEDCHVHVPRIVNALRAK